MHGSIGTRTSVYGSILPGAARLAKVVSVSLAAKRRLAWMDWYQHSGNALLTCRHFGIAPSLFHKWRARFLKLGVRGLETKSTRPRRTREPTTPLAVVDLVKRLRRENPEFSKYKLAVILKRDCGFVLSPSTVGRILTRHQLFFVKPIKPKGHPGRRPFRRRLPKELVVNKPGQLIEVDVKHLSTFNRRHYAFVAIDRVTRQTTVHVASTISSRQAAIAWRKACQQFRVSPKAVLADNGSENLGAFQELLLSERTPQYFARPRTPKDKPYVERVIGTLERECLQWGGLVIDLKDQQTAIDEWLTKYHAFRPHQALGYLTPNEYADKLTTNVSTR